MPSSPTLSPGQQCRPRGPSPSPRERVTDSDVTPVEREVTRARPGRRVARRRAAPTAAVCGGRRGDVHLDQGPPVLRPACGDLAPTSSSEGVPSRAQTVEADLRLRAAAGPDASGRLSGAVLGGGLSSAHVDDGRRARCRDAAWSRWRGPPRAGPSGSAVGLRVAPPALPPPAPMCRAGQRPSRFRLVCPSGSHLQAASPVWQPLCRSPQAQGLTTWAADWPSGMQCPAHAPAQGDR